MMRRCAKNDLEAVCIEVIEMIEGEGGGGFGPGGMRGGMRGGFDGF
jgi:hypothetical protein